MFQIFRLKAPPLCPDGPLQWQELSVECSLFPSPLSDPKVRWVLVSSSEKMQTEDYLNVTEVLKMMMAKHLINIYVKESQNMVAIII